MPVRKCIICVKRSLGTINDGNIKSYFSFPKDENLRKKWIDVCKCKIDNIITARICSDHFKEEDFFHSKSGTDNVKKKRLKCNVVPSLNLEAGVGKPPHYTVNIQNSNKENSKKDSTKGPENIKQQNSVLQTKRKSSSGNKNIKHQIKRKSISEFLNSSSNYKNGKELNNKENTKELAKRKNNSKVSLGIKETSQKKNYKELLKKKSKIVNNISINNDLHRHDTTKKKSVNKENQLEIGNEKLNHHNSNALSVKSKEKLSIPMMTKSSKTELNKKKSHPKSNSEGENKMKDNSEVPNELTKQEISENNTGKISNENDDTNVALGSISRDVNKKCLKRKSLISHVHPRKMYRKRIRLGRDDSEDSEDSSNECSKTNNISREKITYKSPSEMARNEDLLKYLNYLKEKSQSSDQPILFWVDN